MLCEKLPLRFTIFQRILCVFSRFLSSFEKVAFMALYSRKIQVWVAPKLCGIHSKPSLMQKTFPYIVSITLAACACSKHVYAWLECAYAYACMRVHTQSFPQPFFSKNKLYFPQILSLSQFSSNWVLNQPWALEYYHYWGMGARVDWGPKCSVCTYGKLMK